MGLGLLLIGYFLANIMPVISFLSAAMLLGYLVMAVATFRLAPYQKRFLWCFGLSLLALPVALYYTLYGFGVMAPNAILCEAVYGVVEWVYFAVSFAFHAFLLWSVADLCAELGLFTLQSNAWRNLTFMALYQLLYLLINLPIPFVVAHATAFVLPMTLLRYLCVFLNVWLFFRAYRIIAPEGGDTPLLSEEEPPKKKGSKK